MQIYDIPWTGIDRCAVFDMINVVVYSFILIIGVLITTVYVVDELIFTCKNDFEIKKYGTMVHSFLIFKPEKINTTMLFGIDL